LQIASGLKLPVPDISDPALDWKALRRCFPRPPPSWRPWLQDSGSLTEALVRKSHGDFNVVVVEESWSQQHSPYLIRKLGSRLARQRMWSRKVVLQGCGTPWVLAHTLVPQESLTGRLGQVKTLQTKPLGAFLFSHPGLQRDSLDIAPSIDGWGRCSLFKLDNRPILVAEFFLTTLIGSLGSKP